MPILTNTSAVRSAKKCPKVCFAVQKGNRPIKALPIEKLMVRLRSYVSHLFRSLNALIKIKVVGLHPTPDQGGLLVLSSLDAPWRPQRSWKPLVLIGKFAIASEGCVPAPAKASSPSMARLTQFAYSPCGNSEGMVNFCNLVVSCKQIKVIPIRTF